MTGSTTLTSRSSLKRLMPFGMGSHGSARLRHVGWAALISMVMAITQFLQPLDMAIWLLQARMAEQPVSGDIVFVELESGASDPDLPAKRRNLAELLTDLRQSGAERVFIDVLFDEASEPLADAALERSAAAWGQNLAFVNRVDIGLGGKEGETSSIRRLSRHNAVVVAPHSSTWPDVSFELTSGYRGTGGMQQSLAGALADRPPSTHPFPVSYAFTRSSVPSFTQNAFFSASEQQRRAMVEGKRVVLSTAMGATANDLRVPSQRAAPPSYVSIYAAETLRQGGVPFAPASKIIVAIGLVLALSSMMRADWLRLSGYVAVICILTFMVFGAHIVGWRSEAAPAVILVAIYLAMRLRKQWQDRAANRDPDTGLPTLRGLAQRLENRAGLQGHVVVARVHGYENILKTLDQGQRATYVSKLCERVKIGDAKLAIYVDGQHLAWLTEQQDSAKLVDHLEGLRAIFAAPVQVEQHSIDVGITFGAASIETDNRERCLAAALAASQETTEAFEPVKIASRDHGSDTLWDLSLRARIDAAMEAGEVFCVYQPKFDLVANKVVGVEALVRWDDPERGFIPPLHFVMQCEKAGRIEYLTRYVLQSACAAASMLHFRGHRLTMSVNISATLLSDMRIVGIVRNVLQATNFDPHYLVLEITETSRIRDLKVARTVMKALKALGTSLSMDDFGVGAANFEALQALPFDEIKIDRQFVSHAVASAKSRAIAASIVGLGSNAKIKVVAEGAETESDLRMLAEIGCRLVQGYAFARPMPLTNLLTFMESSESPPSKVVN